MDPFRWLGEENQVKKYGPNLEDSEDYTDNEGECSKINIRGSSSPVQNEIVIIFSIAFVQVGGMTHWELELMVSLVLFWDRFINIDTQHLTY